MKIEHLLNLIRDYLEAHDLTNYDVVSIKYHECEERVYLNLVSNGYDMDLLIYNKND